MGRTDAMFSMDVDARGSLSCISFLGRGLPGPAAPASGPSSSVTSLSPSTVNLMADIFFAVSHAGCG